MLPASNAAAQGAPSISLLETAERLARHGARVRDARAVLAAAELMVVVEMGSIHIRRLDAPDMPRGPWTGPLGSRTLLALASDIASDVGDWELADNLAMRLAPVPTPSERPTLPQTVPPPPRAGPPIINPPRPREAPVEPAPARGATGGAVWADAFLKRGSEATYTIEFDAGSGPNRLQVSAVSGQAALECALLDTHPSRAIETVASVAGTCRLQWKQSVRAPMTLRIRNRSADTFFVVSSN